jgi:hypothetical protein
MPMLDKTFYFDNISYLRQEIVQLFWEGRHICNDILIVTLQTR